VQQSVARPQQQPPWQPWTIRTKNKDEYVKTWIAGGRLGQWSPIETEFNLEEAAKLNVESERKHKGLWNRCGPSTVQGQILNGQTTLAWRNQKADGPWMNYIRATVHKTIGLRAEPTFDV
jgi:hypothetical protein